MNADKARPLAAYILVSLVCAAVMTEGMRANPLEVINGSGGRAAAPVSAPAKVVPGTELRARPGGDGMAVPTGFPRISTPGRTTDVAAPRSDGSTTPASGGSSRPAGQGGTPGSTPGVVVDPNRPDGPTTSAGGVVNEGPGTKGKGKKGKGKKPRATQAPTSAHTSDPGKPDRPGKGKGRD